MAVRSLLARLWVSHYRLGWAVCGLTRDRYIIVADPSVGASSFVPSSTLQAFRKLLQHKYIPEGFVFICLDDVQVKWSRPARRNGNQDKYVCKSTPFSRSRTQILLSLFPFLFLLHRFYTSYAHAPVFPVFFHRPYIVSWSL